MADTKNSGLHTARVFVRCPPALLAAVELAAAKKLMTTSEYLRRSAFKTLQEDGIDLAASAEAA